MKNYCHYNLTTWKKTIIKLLPSHRDSSVALLLQNDKNNKLEDKALSRPYLVI